MTANAFDLQRWFYAGAIDALNTLRDAGSLAFRRLSLRQFASACCMRCFRATASRFLPVITPETGVFAGRSVPASS
jgi:hypothetical protein